MITDGELYKKLGDWFHNNTCPLIPQAGMDYPQALIDEFKLFFNTVVTIRLKGFSLEGMPDKSLNFAPPCHLVNLPLIVGLHSGLSQARLIDVATHHPIDVFGLINTLDSIMGTDYTMEDIFEEAIPLPKIYCDCMKVIAKVYPAEFSDQLSFLKERSYVNAASLLSENPAHWPVTRLKTMMKGLEQNDLLPGQYFNDEFFNINDRLISNDYLPLDADGAPNYEVFLERSGMLLAEVARKKLGQIGLWEQMLAVAMLDDSSQRDDTQGIAGLFDYCIHNAPDHLREAIFSGFATMTMVAADGIIKEGMDMYQFLHEKVTDTWLAPLLDSPLLLINLVAEEQVIDFSNESQGLKLPPPQHIYDFHVLNSPETLLDRCLKEIMATAPEQLGASHFRIFLLGEWNPPSQVLSPELKPELVIKHMLQGLEHFSIHESAEDFRDEDTNKFPLKGCDYVIKTLASRYDLDYKALTGISSLGVRVLVEAGLDKRKLPRMNHRDKGHLISEELGL